MKPSEQQRLNTFAAQYNKVMADTKVAVGELNNVKAQHGEWIVKLVTAQDVLEKAYAERAIAIDGANAAMDHVKQKETSLEQREVLFEEKCNESHGLMAEAFFQFEKDISQKSSHLLGIVDALKDRETELYHLDNKVNDTDSRLTVITNMLDSNLKEFNIVKSNLSSAVESHDTFVEEAAKERKNVEIELAKVYLELHTAVESLSNPIAALEARSADLDKRDKAMQIREARFRNAMAEYFPNVTT